MGKTTTKQTSKTVLKSGDTAWVVTRKTAGERDAVLCVVGDLKDAVDQVMTDSARLEGELSPVDLVHCDHEGEEYQYECGDHTYDVVSTEVR